MSRPYAVDTYHATHPPGTPPRGTLAHASTVEVPDRNGQLAHLDAFQTHHEAHGCAVEWIAAGILVAHRHHGQPHAVAIARTLSDQPTPYPPPQAIAEAVSTREDATP